MNSQQVCSAVQQFWCVLKEILVTVLCEAYVLHTSTCAGMCGCEECRFNALQVAFLEALK